MMRRIILTTLAGFALAACSNNNADPGFSSLASTTTTTTETSTAPKKLSDKWANELSHKTRELCDLVNRSMVDCASDASTVLELAKRVKADADQIGAEPVSRAAREAIADATMWTLEDGNCLTSKPGSNERLGCVQALLRMKVAGEDMLAAMYEFEQG